MSRTVGFSAAFAQWHKWSDGHPFTSEDFRYWFEDVAQNTQRRVGLTHIDVAAGEGPRFEYWDQNDCPLQLDAAEPAVPARSRRGEPLYIYRLRITQAIPSEYVEKTEIGHPCQTNEPTELGSSPQ